MSGTREVNDSRRSWSGMFSCLEEKRQQEVREQERPDMVGTELHLYPFGGLLPGVDYGASVVDEDVEGRGQLGDLGGCITDGLLRGEVEGHDLDSDIWEGGIDLLSNSLELRACS